MTCRDYCGKCSKMVGDYDVMCDSCGVSLCYCCATTYDHISELCVEFAKLNVEYNPKLTVGDMRKFINNFNFAKNKLLTTSEYKKNKKYYNEIFEEADEIIKKLLNMYYFLDLKTTEFVKSVHGFDQLPKNIPIIQKIINMMKLKYCKLVIFIVKIITENININDNDISRIIIKPIGFTISSEESATHGITNEFAKSEWLKISDFIKNKLSGILRECDYIVRYNIFFWCKHIIK